MPGKTVVPFAETLPVLHAAPGAAPSQEVQPFGKTFERSTAVPTESITLICADADVDKNTLLNASTCKQRNGIGREPVVVHAGRVAVCCSLLFLFVVVYYLHKRSAKQSAAETAWCDPVECSPPAHRGDAARTWMKDTYNM